MAKESNMTKEEEANLNGNPVIGIQVDTGEKKIAELIASDQIPPKMESDRPYTPASDPDTDPWALPDFQDTGVKWSDLSTTGKVVQVVTTVLKLCGFVFLLYIFVCSLDFLGSSFRLLGGKKAGEVFKDSELLKNPIVGLMIGVLATVLVQSSSTSTSIIVTMVGTKLMSVESAIPIVMGANIGTSVTNTIVSLTQISDRNEFRRAFAAATVHDMFNWLTVIVLLPIEVATGYLKKLTDALMGSGDWSQTGAKKIDFFSKLTKPLTKLIIQIDKKLVADIAANKSGALEKSFIKRCCKKNGTECIKKCTFLFQSVEWSDGVIGGIMLALSLVLLCTSLVLMVKLLHTMLRGRIAVLIKKTINAEPKFPFSILVGYLAILVGCGITILVQSSSIFTSALTPLAGVGMISLERMYPLTLGSNIGTTTTSLLAAMASSSDMIHDALQIAFCHLFFNLSGILIFYPIPYMRFPIPLAKLLGNTTARYRWFSIFYLIMMFFVIPAFVFTVSLAGYVVLTCVLAIILIVILMVIALNIIQRKRPSLLPMVLRDWEFLPECLHSWDPLDRLIMKLFSVCKCCQGCFPAQTAHDGSALGIKTHQSSANILESANPSNESHAMNGIENNAFVWAGGKPTAESTQL